VWSEVKLLEVWIFKVTLLIRFEVQVFVEAMLFCLALNVISLLINRKRVPTMVDNALRLFIQTLFPTIPFLAAIAAEAVVEVTTTENWSVLQHVVCASLL